jgi:SSS family solute:Na+ symporter
MLAANIGAGSTVGATALGYANGISAWWWVGSAGIGSIVLAFWIGPAMRRQADAHQLRTVGDYLEHRYGPAVRALASGILWIGSLFILAGQLWAMGSIIDAVAGIPPWIGCAIGGAVITVYFAASGLLTSAPGERRSARGENDRVFHRPAARIPGSVWRHERPPDAAPTDDYTQFWRAASPGPQPRDHRPAVHRVAGLSRIFGARDDRAVRVGVGLNALGLLVFAIVPALLGMIARTQFPSLASSDSALPMLLVHTVPPLVGAIGLTAVFSAEISASDAVLFMLTTSLSQDFYRRFINPAADDRRVLRVARWTAVASGTLGRCSPSRSAAWSTLSRSSTR